MVILVMVVIIACMGSIWHFEVIHNLRTAVRSRYAETSQHPNKSINKKILSRFHSYVLLRPTENKQDAVNNDVRKLSSSPAKAVRFVRVSGHIGSPERQHLTDRYHQQQSHPYDERNPQFEPVEQYAK
jgi:predicted Holliday junction resolvase-like endonuclease